MNCWPVRPVAPTTTDRSFAIRAPTELDGLNILVEGKVHRSARSVGWQVHLLQESRIARILAQAAQQRPVLHRPEPSASLHVGPAEPLECLIGLPQPGIALGNLVRAVVAEPPDQLVQMALRLRLAPQIVQR